MILSFSGWYESYRNLGHLSPITQGVLIQVAIGIAVQGHLPQTCEIFERLLSYLSPTPLPFLYHSPLLPPHGRALWVRRFRKQSSTKHWKTDLCSPHSGAQMTQATLIGLNQGSVGPSISCVPLTTTECIGSRSLAPGILGSCFDILRKKRSQG